MQKFESGSGVWDRLKIYYNVFKIADIPIGMFLTFIFGKYMIMNTAFKLYKDKEPEYPNGNYTKTKSKWAKEYDISLSTQYSLKVIKHEASFDVFYTKVKGQIMNSIPELNEITKRFIKS